MLFQYKFLFKKFRDEQLLIVQDLYYYFYIFTGVPVRPQ